MRVRGSGRWAGGARIRAILVSAGLHLAVAAFVIGGRTETPPTPASRTAVITLLPPVAEPQETAAALVPLSRTVTPERSRAAPMADPPVVVATLPAVLPPAPPTVQTITTRPEAPPPSNDDAIHDDYARRLWQWIAARRPQGLRLGGEAVVAFRVTRDGGLSDIELVRPSGSKPLDRLALRTVRLSAPVPAPPEALPDDALRFTLTFHFR